MPTTDVVLSRIDVARFALEKANTLQEIKQVSAIADAARLYAKRIGATTEVINHAGEIKLRAERKLGDFMKVADKAKAGRPIKIGSRKEPISKTPTLKESGISKKMSARSQKLADVSATDFEKAIASAKATGELYPNKVAADLIRNSKRTSIKAKLTAIAVTKPETPTGKFDVLVIDPPWPVAKIERDERPNQSGFDYPTMSIGAIEDLVLARDFAGTDCHVFLWATQKFLPTSFQVLERWGVRYLLTLVWHKPGGFQPVNLPQFNCEFCLYGRMGNPQFLDTKAFPTCFDAPRTKHSEKPEEFYELLRRVTAGRRLDAFNRRKIDGFIGWGNEAKRGGCLTSRGLTAISALSKLLWGRLCWVFHP